MSIIYAFTTIIMFSLIQKWLLLNLIQKHPSCKKECTPLRRPLWKKMWNPRWQPRNGCDGRLIAKILITTIQVNLVPNHSETWRRQYEFAWIVIIKIFAINLLSQPFLGHRFGFHIFFHNGLLGGHTLFTAGVGLDFTSFCNCILQCRHISINDCCYLSSCFLYSGRYMQYFMCITHTSI